MKVATSGETPKISATRSLIAPILYDLFLQTRAAVAESVTFFISLLQSKYAKSQPAKVNDIENSIKIFKIFIT